MQQKIYVKLFKDILTRNCEYSIKTALPKSKNIYTLHCKYRRRSRSQWLILIVSRLFFKRYFCLHRMWRKRRDSWTNNSLTINYKWSGMISNDIINNQNRAGLASRTRLGAQMRELYGVLKVWNVYYYIIEAVF